MKARKPHHDLDKEIQERAQEIHADSYPMSIGELMSIYKEGELDIHPEFQRFFRWSALQKSKFIESILLGIPIPSIFVSQREDGVWDVVDGVQRLSSIFEFAGILHDKQKKTLPGSSLLATPYLPSLEGLVWEDDDNPERAFPSSLRLDFKRQKLDLKILKKESDKKTKYDLFERLNTLGSKLSDQEVRNCLLVMINSKFFEWLEGMSANTAFQETISLTDRALQERYDMELALRFLILSRAESGDLKNIKDVDDYITSRMRTIADDPSYDLVEEEGVFTKTFSTLLKEFGPGCFTRQERGRGGFLISMFEVVAMGLGWNLRKHPDTTPEPKKVQLAYKKIGHDKTFREFSRSGKSASSRIPQLVSLGRRLFDIL